MKYAIIPVIALFLAGTILALYHFVVFDGDADQDIPSGIEVWAEGKGGRAAKEPVADLQPVPFTTRDGTKKGWKVTIPGSHPLATPAVADGKVFLGGGFGSHEFYALDAATGKTAWQYRCSDDGPTAAVVQDGYVIFNTESCELEVLTTAGKPVWKKWLGDPLMSMPALDQGRVYMAYPDSKGDGRHYLACFDVKTGKRYWKRPIAGETITTPVVADGQVYLASLEGTLYCFEQYNGHSLWAKQKNATSSPVVWNQQCFFSQRKEISLAQAKGQGTLQMEQLAYARSSGGREGRHYKLTSQQAPYLDYSKKKGSAKDKAQQQYDTSVGFAASKGHAKIDQAEKNLGEGTVAGVWAYQGSKPFISKGRLYAAMGDTLRCVDPETEKVLWTKTFASKGKSAESILTPPVLVNGKLFLGTPFGDVFCLSVRSGKVLWKAAIGEPIVFQPAVANGRIYLATNSGSLYCLETGDPRDDGWRMWGATAAHNGIIK
jgi:Ca-activated chloride channel family protein